MHVFYSARYHIDIGPHVFPTRKYDLVLARLVEMGVIQAADVVEPAPASWEELARVHTAEYLAKMRHGTLSREELAQLELPWSIEMVDGFRTMVGGTVQAARLACGLEVSSLTSQVTRPDRGIRSSDLSLETSGFRVVCHIGGGLHHAFPNHGEGFCPFNDVAVAVRDLQARGLERVAIVDLDVHHGNGTAFVFESAPAVFTFSMHQQHNYPMWKPAGSLDIGLPDGAGDSRYLRELEQALPTVLAGGPQCVFYLAGADPYEDDQLGGLRLTRDGLRRRDRIVIGRVTAAGVPLVVTLAGGYARHVEDTVAIHAATIEEAKKRNRPYGAPVGENRHVQPMTVWLVGFAFMYAFVPGVFAQTSPLPGLATGDPAGFLSRSAFFVSIAGMQTDDPRFSLVQRGRVDLDLFSHRKGRVNFLIDTELVMGTERRAFDLNHANVIFETSSSYRLGPIDVAAVVHHVSRHVVDREFDRVPAWHTVGARAGHLFPTRHSTIDVSLEYGRVVQHTFVDYTWTSQATIRLDRTLRPAARAFASASGGLVGVDGAVLNRGRQAGARAEGGLHFTAKGGVVDLFAAYERRVDGYPTSRQPSSWLEFGFRFGAP